MIFLYSLATTSTADSSTQVTDQPSTTGLTTVSQGTTSSSEGTPQDTVGTTTTAPATTTGKLCAEMEYIQTLIETNAVQTYPTNIPNKQDLITNGVDFTERKPSLLIHLSNGGIIVRDIDMFSKNVAEIEVNFTTASGRETGSIHSAPTSLLPNQFPAEKVTEIKIRITKTSDGDAPQNVTLSVIACAEDTTSTTSQGNSYSVRSHPD